MKAYTADAIKNICLLSHGGVGKTTLLEAMTYSTKASTRIGRTDQGTSMFDTREDEKERGMTIGLKTSFVEWKDKKINVIDTPGFVELISESKAALRVVESTAILVDAMDGIQVGTEQVAKFVEEAGLPKLFFVNKMDKDNANYDKVLQSLVDNFGTSVAPVQIPIGSGPNFTGIVDLLTMEAYTYSKGGDGKASKGVVPDDMKSKVEELRNKLMESVAESDEALMNKFFDAGELSQDELTQGLLNGISSSVIFPVLCGSAVNNMGVDLFMDMVVKTCPSADTVKEVRVLQKGEETRLPAGAGQSLSAFVYKIIADEHMGGITFIRVFSGTLKTGEEVWNASTSSSERIGNLYAMRGLNRNDMTSVPAGDICATLKLKNTHSGNTFSVKAKPVEFPPTDFPYPLVEKAIYPKSKGDEEKISTGLARFHEEDPIFQYGYNADISQTVIAGMGDVHIDIIIKSLQRRFKVQTEMRVPRIPYRETIKSTADAKYRHKKQTGGAGQFAEVWMRIEPKPRGEGIEFTNSLVGQNVDRVYVPSVEKGVNASCREGILAGYRIVDVKVDFYDGKMHPVDSNDVSFQIAGRGAFRDAFMQAKPCLLEPIHDVEVVVPEEYTGDIMGDLSSRRGKIGGMSREGKHQVITAKVPLVELATYIQTLRSITQGRGYYSRKFSHYEELPGDVANKIVESAKKEKEEAAAAR